jgi:putative transposase
MQTVGSEAFETMRKGRYDWQHLMLRTKYSYRLFKNPKTVAWVKKAFEEVEARFGFHIRELGFGEDFAHLHLMVEIPPKFSASQAIQIFKCHSAMVVFREMPNLRKRYPKGAIWSDYRYNGSVGPMAERAVKKYIKKQDIQQTVLAEI